MKKNIIVYLSMSPEEGGKFQYSISVLEDLRELNTDFFNLTALYINELWEPYLNKFSIAGDKISIQENWIYKKLRSLILKKLSLVRTWQFVNKFIGKRYKQIKVHDPKIILYAGSDSCSSEFDFPFITPVFDLMHRYEDFPEVRGKVIFQTREKHYQNICKFSKGLLVDSKVGQQHLLECYNVDSEKIFIYPYKVPYYIKEYKEVDIIKKYNLPDNYLFYPAQFWKHKNHKIIVEAVNKLRGMGEMVNFVFVGSKKNGYNEIIELIDNYKLHEQFFILGYVDNDELVSLYKKAQALVFPSYFGPTNIPPLEALALSCQVIVSDVYAHKEILKDNAYYFNPNSPDELAECIHSFKKKRLNELSLLNTKNIL
ncbi:MAG: glycosyltransferase family 4 protein, partial [Ignavibacteriaceae bacterium]|nr:glycosyltransferase family 4 protein [Ignavibacteriaceae bacterium]